LVQAAPVTLSTFFQKGMCFIRQASYRYCFHATKVTAL
jgi:hypothetical protein